LFNEFYIFLAILGEIFVTGDFFDRRLPTGEGDILDFDFGEEFQVGWRVRYKMIVVYR
jgi:hypothetical protein